MRVLVLDDSRARRTILGSILRDIGFEVITLENASKRQKPDSQTMMTLLVSTTGLARRKRGRESQTSKNE